MQTILLIKMEIVLDKLSHVWPAGAILSNY